jgi:hypothetical protein
MNPRSTLYYNVVAVTEDYLGPAADRFIDHQIRNHLHKNPERLVKKDLSELLGWIRAAMAILTNDDELVNEYVRHLYKLTKDNRIK